MPPYVVKFYRILFLIVLFLFVALINLGQFYGCDEGSCVTPFIVGFDLFWLAIFYIIFDMYRGNWGGYSPNIRLRGFYWFGWFLTILGPVMFYMYSWLPMYIENYNYGEYMQRHGVPTSLGRLLQYLGENFGMWLPALVCLIVAALIVWTGFLIIQKKHPFNKQFRDSKK